MKTRRQRPFGLTVDKPPKVTLTYAETYHMPGLKIKSFCLPTLPSAAPGFEVVEAYVMKAGSLERGAETFEFQDVRIYLRETRQATAQPPSTNAVDPVDGVGQEGPRAKERP